MRRFLYTVALMMILLPCVLPAQGVACRHTKSFTDKVTGGSLAVTNTLENVAYELKHIMFTLPTTNANVFTIAHNRKIKLPDTRTIIVYTNEVDNTDISTNYYYQANGSATFTNSVIIGTTTNDVTTQVYDGSDFGYGWTFEHEDISTFTFTDTNAFYLIRVYDEYTRP